MNLDGVLNSAWSGLDAASRRLAIVSQNVANAGTAGYARESAATQDVPGSAGTRLGLTTRATNDVVQQGLFHANAYQASLDAQNTALAAIDQISGTPGDGTDIGSRLGALQDGFSALAGDPANETQQREVVLKAGELAGSLNQVSQAIGAQRQAAQDSAVTTVGTLNSTLYQIGSLTDQIREQKASGQDTADLENARDAALGQVSQMVDVTVLRRDDGDVLLASGGTILPLRPSEGAFSLGSATLAADTPTPVVPTLMLHGQPASVRGGALGGALAIRDTVLPAQQASLDEFAHTLASRFDAQGLRLFSDPTGAVPPGGAPYTQSGYVGFAGTIGVNPVVSAAPSLVRDGTQAVAGSPTGASAFTPGGPAGGTTMITRVLDFALGAEVQAGVAQPGAATTGLGVDGSIIGAGSGQGALSSLATSLVATQSSAGSNAAAQLGTATTMANTLQAKLTSGTGVSVDGELTTMVQLQQSYAANAKVLTTVNALWSDLLAVVS